MQRLWEELGNVKTMMSGISDELSRFNTLYLGKLEHRMLAIATALSSVDSNVKNLQERAHVWDTFQLHVAAWNEQIKTLDKKVDILSRGHEKLDVMDGKLSALQALDYKVERVAGRVGEAEARLAALARSLDAHRDAHRDSYALFGDVAARGVVSTLRIIERKVDRLQVGLTHIKNHEGHGGGGGGGGRGGGKGGGKNSSGNRSGGGGGGAAAWGVEAEDGGPASVAALGRGKLIIRCNAPAALEELVRDVAAKVDVMFDKMAAGPGGEGAEALVASEPPAPRLAHIHVSELRDLAENKMLERLWRRLTSPFKRTARALEALEGAVRAAANASAAAQHQSAADAAQAARCCAAADRRLEQLLDASRAHEARLDRLARLAPAACDPARAHDRGAAASGNASSRAEEPPPTPPSLPTAPGTSGEEADSGGGGGGGDGDGAGSGDGEEETEGAAEGEGAVEPPFIPVVARNCEDLLGGGGGRPRASGVYKLGGHDLNPKGRDFYTRYCDMHTNGGGWTVIQRRGNFHGRRQKFSLPWKDYKRGFGDLDKEFWFGNDFIHRLTYQKDMVLRIELEAFSGKRAWAEYSSFRVGAAESNYRLTVGGYSGNATDSLQVHDGASFSTADKTNDAAPACCPCAPAYGGGWWFDSCFEANLNGVYFTPKDHREEFRGIIWEHWLGDESLKATEMKIRPKTVTGAIIREDPGFDEHGSSSVDDVDPLDIPEDP